MKSNKIILKIIIGVIAILFLQCKSIQLDKEKVMLKSKFSTLIIENNKFEYIKTNPYYGITKGFVKRNNNEYRLNTFDSIVSIEISFKSIEYTKVNIPKDSILFKINAPLNKYRKDNKYCNSLAYIIEVNESFNRPVYFEKTSFLVKKADIYNINIFPKPVCGYSSPLDELYFFSSIYEEDTNYVVIELPDLDENRFSYLNFKNCELKKVGANKYELFHNDKKEIFELIIPENPKISD